MNTFVKQSRFGGNLYRVCTYVKARNQRKDQFKALTGFLPIHEACEQAQKIAHSR